MNADGQPGVDQTAVVEMQAVEKVEKITLLRGKHRKPSLIADYKGAIGRMESIEHAVTRTLINFS